MLLGNVGHHGTGELETLEIEAAFGGRVTYMEK